MTVVLYCERRPFRMDMIYFHEIFSSLRLHKLDISCSSTTFSSLPPAWLGSSARRSACWRARHCWDGGSFSKTSTSLGVIWCSFTMSQLGSSSAVQPLKCLTSHRSRHTGSPSSSGSKRFKSHVSIAQHEVLFPHLLVLVFDQQLLDKVVPVDAEPPSQLIITIHNNIIHQFALLTDEVACRLYVRLSSAKLPNPVCFIVSQISPFDATHTHTLSPTRTWPRRTETVLVVAIRIWNERWRKAVQFQSNRLDTSVCVWTGRATRKTGCKLVAIKIWNERWRQALALHTLHKFIYTRARIKVVFFFLSHTGRIKFCTCKFNDSQKNNNSLSHTDRHCRVRESG